ncbi:MAG: DUF1295 domain-containing protein [Gordonia sp. (in: high G+C Gram-positive bacteria)]
MTGVSGALTILAVSAVWIAALQTAAFAAGIRLGRVNVVDVIWGPGFAGIGLIAAVLGGGGPVRRVVLAVAVAVWGVRLAVNMHLKTRGHGEDPRYTDYLGAHPGRRIVAVKVFGVQGLSQLWVGLPLIVAAVEPDPRGWRWAVFGIGVAVYLTGLGFETIGDRQLAVYRADPGRPPVLDTGLWAWTRHPNYFGDACVWWGIWLIAATCGAAWFTVLSPIAMTYFLVYATGARRLEQLMSRRPAYREYQRRTAYFVPRPPSRS